MQLQKFAVGLVIVLASVSLSACSLLPQSETTPATVPPVEEERVDMTNETSQLSGSESSSDSGMAAKMIAMTEVAKHATKTDCWTVIEGSVYDLTPVTSTGTHPGGPVIEKACGTDGTVLFTTRGGKGPHPEKAQMGLENLIIGTLAQ